MKVVILCGGKGTRLREETEFKPKPLVDFFSIGIYRGLEMHNTFPLKNTLLKEINHCFCVNPDKKYSTGSCTACWTCKICGKFGGCDNNPSLGR